MSASDEDAMVAASLDATPALLPYLPELFADLWELGSSPEQITDWLREADLPREARVLDLGCGKGAVSLTLARELGFHMHGVDLFEPFVRDARARAEAWGLTALCRFEKGDLLDVVRSASGYDVVIYAAVGALGRLDASVEALRRCVRQGGYMIIDEGCLAPGVDLGPGFESLAPHEESKRRLTAHGDAIVREHLLDPDEMRALDRWYIERIAPRAESLHGGAQNGLSV